MIILLFLAFAAIVLLRISISGLHDRMDKTHKSLESARDILKTHRETIEIVGKRIDLLVQRVDEYDERFERLANQAKTSKGSL